MSHEAIRDSIRGILASVDGVGNVYDYPRLSVDWDVFIGFYKTADGRVLGFEIDRTAAVEEYDDTVESRRTHTFVIRGYHGLRDATGSNKSFQSLVEAVCAKFRFAHDLGGVAGTQIIKVEPVQVARIDDRMFGDVLCHYAEMTLRVTELVVQE